MFRKLIASISLAAVASIGLGASVASATPIDPTPTCIRDYKPVPCVKRTWHPTVRTSTRLVRGHQTHKAVSHKAHKAFKAHKVARVYKHR